MRTIPFKQVFDRVVRWHGRDPRKEVAPDMREALVERINDRVRQIWSGWRWPEWEITEERAFRPIWSSSEEYLRESITDGRPDEVFYLGDSYVTGGDFGDNYGYYRVLSSAVDDPPVGTLPTDTDYWETLDPVEAFIAYDQRDRRSIGMVLGTYSANPRSTNFCNYGSLHYMPSEKGIEVRGTGLPTVFITHKMPCPQYTLIPYVVGRTYARADVVFDPTTGDCFQAVRETTTEPEDLTTADDWNLIPFLDRWTKFVVYGAYADSLLEIDQAGNQDVQAKLVLAQAAEVKAMDALQASVDEQVTQGQTLQWNFCKHYGDWCETRTWSGGMVTLIDQ